MSESGDWYCRNCGYITSARVTHSETCDQCHIPVEWHDAEQQDELTTLRAKVAELEAVAAPFEQLARDKLFTDSNLGRPDDCGAFGSDNITVTLGDCRRLIAAFDTPLTEEGTLPDRLKDPKTVLERGQELLDTEFNPPEDGSDG